VKILSGVFEGVTTGTPIALHIDNVDQRSRDYSEIKDKFRPAHADYTYFKKYGVRDYRGGGRQSARETAVRVAAGAIAARSWATREGARRGGPARHAKDRSQQMGLGRHGRQSLLVPRRQAAQGWEGYLDDVRKRAARVAPSLRSWRRAFPSGWAIRSTTSSMPTSPRA